MYTNNTNLQMDKEDRSVNLKNSKLPEILRLNTDFYRV